MVLFSQLESNVQFLTFNIISSKIISKIILKFNYFKNYFKNYFLIKYLCN